ncbi:MAG: hypothetical protein KDJ47_09660 [Hyphomicrobiaceae bacterium]|nr:hypothetical protein [Hyphomicrobiaceae bacterium]
MNSPPPNWQQSQQVSHSNEIEHRLTAIETVQIERLRTNEQRRREGDRTMKQVLERLTLHERAILILASAVSVLMQDKWPGLAELIRGALK